MEISNNQSAAFLQLKTNMANLEELIRQHHLFDPQEVGIMFSGNCNQIFYATQVSDTFTYYFPAYLRLSFNSISGLDFKNLKADIHCDLILTINVKDLPNSVAAHVRDNIQLLFANDNQIKVKEINADEEEDQDEENQEEIYVEEEKEIADGKFINHYIHYQIRKTFKTNMVAELFLTPFEEIDLILMASPRVNPMLISAISEQDLAQRQNFPAEFWTKREQKGLFDEKGKRKKRLNTIHFAFNLMDCPGRKHETINYGLTSDFGNYSVATAQLDVEYTNENSSKKIIERSKQINRFEEDTEEAVNYNRIKPFEFAHFVIKIFRNPNSAAGTIFIPIVLLTIINLGIFYQDNLLAGRIQNIAGLMFAYIAIIQVIREQIPINPSVTLIEIIVFLLTGTTLLCLIEGVIIRNLTSYPHGVRSGFFLSSLVISILSGLVVIFLLIWHHSKRVPYFTQTDEEYGLRSDKFDHLIWQNDDCDHHFMKFFDNGKVRSVRPLIKYE